MMAQFHDQAHDVALQAMQHGQNMQAQQAAAANAQQSQQSDQAHQQTMAAQNPPEVNSGANQ
jgi:hypothetical protein